MNWLKFFRALTLTGAVYGFLGWVYIVVNSEVHIETLKMQLTHFAPWPHEDTFGEVCFAISITSFFIYQLLRRGEK